MAKYRISKERKALIDSITEEQLKERITLIAAEAELSELLAIPGVWDLVAEHYNNQAIDELVYAAENPAPAVLASSVAFAGKAPAGSAAPGPTPGPAGKS